MHEKVPLSHIQEQMWYLSQIGEDSSYTLTMGVHLRGKLDLLALKRSLSELVRRHESLRTRIVVDEVTGLPFQQIQPVLEPDVTMIELSSTDKSKLQAKLKELASQPIRPESENLVRFSLIVQDAFNFSFVLSAHHLIFDYWSIGLFIRELSELYAADVLGRKPQLPEVPVQYADYAIWERNMAEKVDDVVIQYWKRKFAPPLPALQLPTDFPRAHRDNAPGKRQSFFVTDDHIRNLRKICLQKNATLAMGFLSVYIAFLYYHTRQEDIIIGMPYANRRQKDFENIIGCFIDLIGMRFDLKNSVTFLDLLDNVRHEVLACFRHHRLPFKKIIELVQPSRKNLHAPIFQVLFNFMNLGKREDIHLPELKAEPFVLESHNSKFDLSIDFTENDSGVWGSVEYATDLFTDNTIEAMIGNFQSLLRCMIENPETPFKSISFNSASNLEFRSALEEITDFHFDSL